MAVMNEETLKSRIKMGKLSSVYILYGEDGYLKKLYAEKLRKTAVEQDDVFNFQRFDGGCDLQDVYDAVTQLPIMADKKCVILCDYDFEHCAKSNLDRLCQLPGETGEDTLLLLLFDSLPFDAKKSAKFKKLTSAVEKAGGAAVQLNHRQTSELVKMLIDGARKRGCQMEPTAARCLIENAGEDIDTLISELDKLCFFKPGGTVTQETVELVSTKTVEASVYNLSKFILSRQTRAAMQVLDDLFFMQTEPITIFYAISASYIDMYRLFVFGNGGKAELIKLFNYKNKEFLLDRAAQNLRGFDFKRLSLSLDALLAADKGLKTAGADGRLVLEQLIIRLIYIAARGETVDKA